MLDSHLLVIFSVEILFLGFICVAGGSWKAGYFSIIAGSGLLCFAGILKQGLTTSGDLSPEDLAAAALLIIIFVGFPFVLIFRKRKEKKRSFDAGATISQH